MNGVELLLHVVGGEEVGHTSQLEQKVVLETEDGGGSDDSSLGEQFPGNLLSSALIRLSITFPR